MSYFLTEISKGFRTSVSVTTEDSISKVLCCLGQNLPGSKLFGAVNRGSTEG